MYWTWSLYSTAGPLCRVCGKNAIGENFGCHTCADCRFSVRNDVQCNLADKYKCVNNRRCFNDPTLWYKCNKCRFDRCLDAGMQKDMVHRGNPLFSTEVSVEDLKQNINGDKIEQNHRVIRSIYQAFEQIQPSTQSFPGDLTGWNNVTEAINSYYKSFMNFIAAVPSFTDLNLNDQ